MLTNVLLLLCGFVLLALSSDRFVLGECAIAHNFGITPMVVGPTVVALGTSAPEILVSAAAALDGYPSMALGNVLGSNMFNLLPVLAIAALISPFGVEPIALSRDFPIMAVLTVVLLVMCMGWRGPGQVTRLEAAVLLVCLTGYQTLAVPDARVNRGLLNE